MSYRLRSIIIAVLCVVALLAAGYVSTWTTSPVVSEVAARQAPGAATGVFVAAPAPVVSSGTACGDASTRKYVRAGAGGTATGDDWTNAYTALPAALTRGTTYCLADGSYGTYAFDDAPSGATLISVVKATTADHGTETGWVSTYGDGAATFTWWDFSTSYYVIDGQVGGGPGAWNSGFGFTLFSSSSILITFTGSVTNITLRHFGGDSDRGTTYIAGLKATTGTVSNIQIDYCALTEIFGPVFHISNWSDVVIEYCFFYWNRNTAVDHTEMVSSIGSNNRLTWRWSIYDRIEGTAVFAGVNTGSSTDWKVYGNVFSRSVGPWTYYCEGGSNQQSVNGLRFYNNTLTGMTGPSQGGIQIQAGCGGSADNEVRNNIWYGNDANTFDIAATNSHNFASDNIRTDGCAPACDMDSSVLSGGTNGQDSSGSPFVSYNADPLVGNFQLSTATNAGQTLASPYNVDREGVTRGSGGVWDRGALEKP